MRRLRFAVLAVLVAACGDDAPATPDAPAGPDAPPDADARDIADRLAALPNVTVTEQPNENSPGYRYFVLQFTQPVDHEAPGATFQQRVSLIHRDVAAPMIALTTGYEDYFRDFAAEPTRLLAANQISIEHRYFAGSRPVDPDWTKLTIAQMAADQHAIVVALKAIYGAAWISTGASKGGMTASYHRRFYPDDVDGTIAYVAPLSLAIPDARYLPQFETIGGSDPTCRDRIRALMTEMLANRRAALLTLAQTDAVNGGHAYTRIALDAALESAIRDLEWTFWQYYGLAYCDTLPTTEPALIADAQLWGILQAYSQVSFQNDDNTASFEAYFYQAYAQLGSPGTLAVRGDSAPAFLAPHVMFTESDYRGGLPIGVPVPAHDPAPMLDIDTWIQAEGARFIFVYGEFDPWTGGTYRLGDATDSLLLTVAGGTHGASLDDLAPADRAAALAKLAAWTGVTPNASKPHASTPRPARARFGL